MNTSLKNVIIGIALIIATVIAYLLFNANQSAITDIQFTDIDGQQHQLSDYQGQASLVIFWATDCPGCIKEMPSLVELYHDYSDNLQMIGVAMPHDTLEHIQAMRETKQIPYTLTWDKEGAITEAFNQVRVTPTHFLISAEGKIVMRKIGEIPMTQLKQRLAAMGVEPNNG